MVARPRELLLELGAAGSDRLKCLKQIRNQVIGNKSKKAAFVGAGAVKDVLEALRSSADPQTPSSPEVQKQAAVVLGSLAYTEAGLRELLAAGGLPALLVMLKSGDSSVVEAGLRAVKMVVQQSYGRPSGAIGSARLDADAIAAVVRCLDAPPATDGPTAATADPTAAATATTPGAPSGGGAGVASMAATVVACCCCRQEERDLAIAAGAAEGLIRLMLAADRPDTQVSALEGLSLLLPAAPAACAAALASPGLYGRLQALLRDPRPPVRLLAAGAVATLSRSPGCQQPEAMQRAALPVLLRLLAEPATRPAVPAVLARLIEGSEQLQKAAADADTVRLLAGLLAAEAAPAPAPALPPAAAAAAAATTVPAAAAAAGGAASAPPRSGAAPAAAAASSCGSGGSGAALREGCLRALGSLCLNRDDSRKQLLEAKVLRHIVRALEDPADGVRCAAALVVRALSRSVRALRGSLLEGGELAGVLVGLLADRNEDVRASAAAALCNLVLDFSAAKVAVLAAGGLPRLAALAASPGAPQLRHHATWALANLLFRADGAVRAQLMAALPWPRVRALLSDPDPGVVEQALVLLRNLAMGDRPQLAAVLAWAGEARREGAAAPAGAGRGWEAEGGLLAVLQGRLQEAAGAAGAAAMEVDAAGAEAGPQEQEGQQQQQQEESDRGAPMPLLAASPSPNPYALVRTPSASPSASPSGSASASPSASPPASPPASSPAASAAAASAATHAAHALYTLANLLTGGHEVRDAVASRAPLLAAVVAQLRPEAAELALPAVWCLINLTWPHAPAPSSPGGAAGAAEGRRERERERDEGLARRCRTLVEAGAEPRLEALLQLQRGHQLRDVAERAGTALEQLRRGLGAGAAAGGGLGGARGAGGAAAVL